MRITKLDVFSNRLVGEHNFRRKEIKLAAKLVNSRESVLDAYSVGYRDALLEAVFVVAEILRDEDFSDDKTSFEAAVHTVLNHAAWHLC